jgi:hypothetical protein
MFKNLTLKLIDILELLSLISLKDLMRFVILPYFIYLYIKSPLNSYIYSNINVYLFALVLAIIVSTFITFFTRKLWDFLLLKFNLDWLDIPLAYLFTFCSDYGYILLFDAYPGGDHSGPIRMFSFDMQLKIKTRIVELNNIKRDLIFRINKIEPIASALSRDNTNPKNLPLSQCFQEHVRDSKSQLAQVNKELNHYDRMEFLKEASWSIG